MRFDLLDLDHVFDSWKMRHESLQEHMILNEEYILAWTILDIYPLCSKIVDSSSILATMKSTFFAHFWHKNFVILKTFVTSWRLSWRIFHESNTWSKSKRSNLIRKWWWNYFFLWSYVTPKSCDNSTNEVNVQNLRSQNALFMFKSFLTKRML